MKRVFVLLSMLLFAVILLTSSCTKDKNEKVELIAKETGSVANFWLAQKYEKVKYISFENISNTHLLVYYKRYDNTDTSFYYDMSRGKKLLNKTVLYFTTSIYPKSRVINLRFEHYFTNKDDVLAFFTRNYNVQ